METKIIKIDGKDYNVKFPNVSQVMEIESLKMALTNGNYGLMVESNTKSSNFNLDLVDSVGTFTILIPELRKEYGNIASIEMKKAIHLIAAYKKQFYPWFKELNDQITSELNQLLEDEAIIGEKQ